MLFALVFPTIITWGYFVLAARYSTGAQQATYLIVKIIQFAFPLVWVWLVLARAAANAAAERAAVCYWAPRSASSVVGAGWLLFDFVLRDTTAFRCRGAMIHEKIAEFGIDSAVEICRAGRVLFALSFAAGGVLLAMVCVSPVAPARAAVAGDPHFRARRSWGIT